VTVSNAVFATPNVAVIVGVVLTITDVVETEKLAEVAPPKTMTFPGTVATAVLLLPRVTVVPALGAGPVKVTVPVELFPPETLVGDKINDDTVGAKTVRVAVFPVM
jgi:hypothetical protein